MFNIPIEHSTNVGIDEKFYVASVFKGIAKLCGNKITLEVPSDDLYLGEVFIATKTNRLVRPGSILPEKVVVKHINKRQSFLNYFPQMVK